MWTWILIGLDIITKMHGFSNGNFPQSCNSLSPQHPVGNGTNFSAQTSAAPFMVDFESRNPGDPITVVLRSTGSTEFRGFMMEAREAAPANSSPLVGTFISLNTTTTRLLTCNGLVDSAVSQRNNRRKSLFRVNWTAPQINQDIVFRATFLEKFAVFWENVTSTFRLSTTTPAPNITTNTPAPTTTTNTPAPTTTTNTQASTQAPAGTTGDCVSPPRFGGVCPPNNTSAPNTTTDTPAQSNTTITSASTTTTNTSETSIQNVLQSRILQEIRQCQVVKEILQIQAVQQILQSEGLQSPSNTTNTTMSNTPNIFLCQELHQVLRSQVLQQSNTSTTIDTTAITTILAIIMIVWFELLI